MQLHSREERLFDRVVLAIVDLNACGSKRRDERRRAFIMYCSGLVTEVQVQVQLTTTCFV